jgi:hypothetical protein
MEPECTSQAGLGDLLRVLDSVHHACELVLEKLQLFFCGVTFLWGHTCHAYQLSTMSMKILTVS